jgi:hypothetical protein
MRFVSINNYLWAVGLHWETSPTRRLSGAELKRRAGELGAEYDTVAFRPRQYAFGVSGGQDCGHARSLSAFLNIPSMVGLFTFKDALSGELFWWVCGRSKNMTVGIGDQVFDSRDAAGAELVSLGNLLDIPLDNPDVPVVVRETPEESLRWLAPLLRPDMAARLSQRGMLVPLGAVSRRTKHLLAAAAVAAVTAVCVWGVIDMLESIQRTATMEASRLTRLDTAQRRADVRAHPEKYFAQAWTSAPLADVAGGRCLSAVEDTPLYSNGWRMEYVTCAGDALNTGWLYQPGADFVHLPARAKLKDEQPPRHAVSSRALPPLAPGTRRDQDYSRLLTHEYALRLLHQLRRDAGARSVSLDFAAPEKRRIDDLKADVVAPWRKGKWELKDVPAALMLDLELMRNLSALPGLVLEEISYSGNIWTIKGVIYVE